MMLAFASSGHAQQTEKRIALVIGNSAYQVGALSTSANNAGLVAQTLQAAGFDVVGARDLDADTLRRAFRDFVEKADAAGPETVAFVYFSGYGLQLEGENYIVPIDARIARDTDLPAEAIRLSDYTRSLAVLQLKARIIVVDAARLHPFAKSGSPLAGGLALIEPEPGTLIAYNAAPGTVAPDEQGAYGPYAQALSEMMRDGGLTLAELFERVRLRVNDVTKGAQVPWSASKVEASFVFFERAPDAPPPAISDEQVASVRTRPIADLGARAAYVAAIERDRLQYYLDFLAAYPDDPMAGRVRLMVAARREAITWHRTRRIDTPPAYWTYLRRYPRGAHAYDARRRLAYLAAELEPPASFAAVTYDVPPPSDEEMVYVERPVLQFDDPDFGFEPPPPVPVVFLPPPPEEFWLLPPPPPPVAAFVLPVPVYVPVPLYCRPPAHIVRPVNNVIFANIHNRVVINNRTNVIQITERSGQTRTITGPVAGGTGNSQLRRGPQHGEQAEPQGLAAVGGLGPALPPSVARKATLIQPDHTRDSRGGGPSGLPTPGTVAPGRSLPGLPSGQPQRTPSLPAQGALTKPDRTTLGKPLAGTHDQPLPNIDGKPPIGTPSLRTQMPRQQSALPKAEVKPLSKPLPDFRGTVAPNAPKVQARPNTEQPPAKRAAEDRLRIEQQRQLQVEQQHKLQIEHQRQQQLEQQRKLQLEQQARRADLQRKLQLEQQRQQPMEQQRRLQINQQQQVQRQQQIEQQRKLQVIQQQQIQRQQQMQQPRPSAPPPPIQHAAPPQSAMARQAPPPQPPRQPQASARNPACGGRGQPPCHH